MIYDPLVDDLSRAYLDEGALPPAILRELHEAKVERGMKADREAALAELVELGQAAGEYDPDEQDNKL